MKQRLRPGRAERGASAVEFALVSGILFTLIFGTIQYGLYFWSLQSGAQAAREAARQAAVGSLDCDALRAAVLNNSQGERAGTVEVTRTFWTDETLSVEAGDPPDIGGAVEVTVTFESIDLGLPFVPFIDGGRIAERSVARVENVTANSQDCA